MFPPSHTTLHERVTGTTGAAGGAVLTPPPQERWLSSSLRHGRCGLTACQALLQALRTSGLAFSPQRRAGRGVVEVPGAVVGSEVLPRSLLALVWRGDHSAPYGSVDSRWVAVVSALIFT